MAAFICAAVAPGLLAAYKAAAPVTCGVAIEENNELGVTIGQLCQPRFSVEKQLIN